MNVPFAVVAVVVAFPVAAVVPVAAAAVAAVVEVVVVVVAFTTFVEVDADDDEALLELAPAPVAFTAGLAG